MTRNTSTVSQAYETLRDKAINFEFKPGDRINESALTRELGISRTPMREALNRLVAEGFLTLSPGQGFRCRTLQPDAIADLYELRCALESEAVRRMIEAGDQSQIDALVVYLDQTEPTYHACDDASELTRMDENFHLMIARGSGNREIANMLTNVNERIRYVRTVNLKQLRLRPSTTGNASGLNAHRRIVSAILSGNTEEAVAAMRRHIERRKDEVVELVKLAYSEIYVS